jgi:integrase
MPDGSCVVPYHGKRGTTWRVKYRDATGTQVMETLGKASDGWTKRKAEVALRARLTDVHRTGYRRPEPTSFATFAERWRDEYPITKGLKRSTREGYEAIIETHLVPFFEGVKLVDVDVAQVERYVARKRKEGLKGATVNRHLNVLSLVLKAALRQGLVRLNPVQLVDRPREPLTEWRITAPVEVASVEKAFSEMIEAESEGSADRTHIETCRVVFLVVQEAALRRGEILGLRWRHTALADPDVPHLRIVETLVRGRADTPKSDASTRTIPISSALADELFSHRSRSAYQGDDERVFVSAYRPGSPLNVKLYAATLRKALAKAGITEYVRPFHDGRHSAITNAARAGRGEMALTTIAGHSDSRITRRYTHLAGVMFADEAERMGGSALWSGATSRKNGRKSETLSPVEATKNPA